VQIIVCVLNTSRTSAEDGSFIFSSLILCLCAGKREFQILFGIYVFGVSLATLETS